VCTETILYFLSLFQPLSAADLQRNNNLLREASNKISYDNSFMKLVTTWLIILLENIIGTCALKDIHCMDSTFRIVVICINFKCPSTQIIMCPCNSMMVQSNTISSLNFICIKKKKGKVLPVQAMKAYIWGTEV